MFAYMCTQLGHGDMCNCRGTQGLSTKRTNMTATTPSMYVCMHVCMSTFMYAAGPGVNRPMAM